MCCGNTANLLKIRNAIELVINVLVVNVCQCMTKQAVILLQS